jgi:hypothetical protein
VPEHNHGVPSGNLVLFGPESAAERGLDSEYAKEVTADHIAILQLRLRFRIRGEAGRRQLIGHQSAEGSVLVAEVRIIRIREVA